MNESKPECEHKEYIREYGPLFDYSGNIITLTSRTYCKECKKDREE